jgi:hypothetical protein
MEKNAAQPTLHAFSSLRSNLDSSLISKTDRIDSFGLLNTTSLHIVLELKTARNKTSATSSFFCLNINPPLFGLHITCKLDG